MTSSSWYRRSLLSYKGNREYTRHGFETAKVRFVEDDLEVDCSDRHYMITGSNSGLGLQTALEVARRGGVIHMVCRCEASAKRARSEIITTTGNDRIHLHIVDLSQPREVMRWCQQFAAQHEKLHVLVNNASCLVHHCSLDQDGVETNFAVNTLAVHILTLHLLPVLQRNEDSRVINVSCAGMLTVRLDPTDLMHQALDPFLGPLVYAQSKRQQVVMTLWYAQRYDKVHFSCMHPGWVDTPNLHTSDPEFYETMKEQLRSPAEGADTIAWLAFSPAAIKHPSGLFFQDREPVPSHLPLAWTKTTIEEENAFMMNLHKFYNTIHEKVFGSDGEVISVAPQPSTFITSSEPSYTAQPAAPEPPSAQPAAEQLKEKETVEIKPLPPPPSPASTIVPPVTAPPTTPSIPSDHETTSLESPAFSPKPANQTSQEATEENQTNTLAPTPSEERNLGKSPVEPQAAEVVGCADTHSLDATVVKEEKNSVKSHVEPPTADVNSTVTPSVNATSFEKEEPGAVRVPVEPQTVDTDSTNTLPTPSVTTPTVTATSEVSEHLVSVVAPTAELHTPTSLPVDELANPPAKADVAPTSDFEPSPAPTDSAKTPPPTSETTSTVEVREVDNSHTTDDAQPLNLPLP